MLLSESSLSSLLLLLDSDSAETAFFFFRGPCLRIECVPVDRLLAADAVDVILALLLLWLGMVAAETVSVTFKPRAVDATKFGFTGRFIREGGGNALRLRGDSGGEAEGLDRGESLDDTCSAAVFFFFPLAATAAACFLER